MDNLNSIVLYFLACMTCANKEKREGEKRELKFPHLPFLAFPLLYRRLPNGPRDPLTVLLAMTLVCDTSDALCPPPDGGKLSL